MVHGLHRRGSSVLLRPFSVRPIAGESANSGSSATSGRAGPRIIPGSLLDRINSQEADWQKLSDEELKQTATKFRARLAAGETLDDILPDAFAAVREAGRRFLKMRHYDVQMIGGYFLHKGMIAEMVTGEGKTLVATLPAFLNGLAGSVHVVTVNDYLARRDMEWMGPLYLGLGLTVGAIQANMDSEERKVAYDCDITYGTNNEFGFDYLRDNMKPAKEIQVQRPLQLRDRRRNRQHPDRRSANAADHLRLRPRRHVEVSQGRPHRPAAQKGVHFEVKEKEHTCNLTDAGVREAEKLAGVESFYTAGNMEWPHLIDNSLKAHHLYKRDVNYVVEQGQVIIVDEFTGRKMEGRQWSDGLHQAVEAKEGVHDQGRDADPGHDHAAELLQALQEARRHDRHGHDRGRRVLEDLQARRRDDSHEPAAAARQRHRRDLPQRAREVERRRRRDSRSPRRRAGRSWSAPSRSKNRRC